jgi:hypothetical protein
VKHKSIEGRETYTAQSYPQPQNSHYAKITTDHGGLYIPPNRSRRRQDGQFQTPQSTTASPPPPSQSYAPNPSGIYNPVQPQPHQTYSSYSHPQPPSNFSPASSSGTAAQSFAPQFAPSFTSSPQSTFSQYQSQPGIGLGVMASPLYGQPQGVPQQYMPQQNPGGQGSSQYNNVCCASLSSLEIQLC